MHVCVHTRVCVCVYAHVYLHKPTFLASSSDAAPQMVLILFPSLFFHEEGVYRQLVQHPLASIFGGKQRMCQG